MSQYDDLSSLGTFSLSNLIRAISLSELPQLNRYAKLKAASDEASPKRNTPLHPQNHEQPSLAQAILLGL